MGRPSIPPEKLLRALLLQAFYSIRSERQLMEQMNYNLLFRWFVGLGMDDAGLGRDGLHQEPRPAAGGRHRRQVPGGGAEPAAGQALLSDEHFSVDGTLIEAWAASRASAAGAAGEDDRPCGGDAPRSRKPSATSTREKRSNETHASTTDPDARLFRKGRGQGGQALLSWATC